MGWHASLGSERSLPGRFPAHLQTWLGLVVQCYMFTYLLIFLAVLGLCSCKGFSLVAESWSSPRVVVCGPLIAVASPVVGHRP